MQTHITQNKATRLFLILTGFFVANVFIAEFIGIKIFSLEATLGFERFSWKLFGQDNMGFDLTAGGIALAGCIYYDRCY